MDDRRFRGMRGIREEHGVILGLQQHNDFLKTADETIRVIAAVTRRGSGTFWMSAA